MPTSKARTKNMLRQVRRKVPTSAWVKEEGQPGYLPLPLPNALDGEQWDVREGGQSKTDLQERRMQVRAATEQDRYGQCHEMLHSKYTPRDVKPSELAAQYELTEELVQAAEDLRLGLLSDLVFGEMARVTPERDEAIRYGFKAAALDALYSQRGMAHFIVLLLFRFLLQPHKLRYHAGGFTLNREVSQIYNDTPLLPVSSMRNAMPSWIQHILAACFVHMDKEPKESKEKLENFEWTKAILRRIHEVLGGMDEVFKTDELLHLTRPKGGSAEALLGLPPPDPSLLERRDEMRVHWAKGGEEFESETDGKPHGKTKIMDGGFEMSGHLTIMPLKDGVPHPSCGQVRAGSRPRDEGALVKHMARFMSDGRIFAEKRRKPGGSLLIDYSGSMSLTENDLNTILQHLPMARIATYAGSGDEGELRIISWEGKISKTPLQHPNAHGGNIVDFPSLVWLAKQSKPLVWLSDGMVTGKSESSHEELRKACYGVCDQHGIYRANDFVEALAFLKAANYSMKRS